MEYHSAVTRNELSSHEDAWKKLQCISQSERSQSEKTPTVGIQLSDIRKGKTMEARKRSVAARRQGTERTNRPNSEHF